MPPKPKFTRDQIIEAAYNIVREGGENALTARELGKRLGTSSSPVFTVFQDMEELKGEIRVRAKATFEEYMLVADNFNPAYKKRGMQWIKFAQEEPRLFEMMFMQPSVGREAFDKAPVIQPFGKERDIQIIMRDYNASEEQAEHLFRQLWTYTYGLCVLCAEGVCSFKEEELSDMLSEIFFGMVFVLTHSEQRHHMDIFPKNTDEGKRLRADFPDLGNGKGDNE